MSTSLENFHRMNDGRVGGWLPLDMTATPPVLDAVEAHCGTRSLLDAFDLDFAPISGFDDLANAFPEQGRLWRQALADRSVTLPANSEVGFAGVTFVVPPLDSIGKAYHLRQWFHPLAGIQSVTELESLPWLDVSDARVYDAAPIEVAHARGKVATVWMECTVFELAWYVRGMDNLFVDLLEGNGIGDWLLDWFTHRSVIAATARARAGADVIGLGDDVGTQRGMLMAPDFWRQHLKPRLAKVTAAIRDNQLHPITIRYHSDGDIRPIIDDLIEIGIDMLNPVQPECMPVSELVPAYQDRLGFWGLIGTQTTMPFGSPDDVRRSVEQCAALARNGARIVVAPTHVLEPDVPWENIEALVAATRQARP